MENKINLVEILKNCPKGMELDCTIWNGVTFEGIVSGTSYPIEIKIGDKGIVTESLTEFGEWNSNENSKCIIFPKGKTTWEGFVPPIEFKEGDIIYTLLESDLEFISIFKKASETLIYTYVDLGTQLYIESMRGLCKKNDIKLQRLATEEEIQKLFDAIKDNGYKWNAETKSLEKLIEPKFNVGDRIRYKRGNRVKLNIASININEQFYHTSDKGRVYFKYQDDWDLVPDKFDITTLVPFESRVLVREDKTDVWQPSYYGFLDQRNKRFYTTTDTWLMCIPYNEDTKHLIGTTDDCDEFYKTWE